MDSTKKEILRLYLVWGVFSSLFNVFPLTFLPSCMNCYFLGGEVLGAILYTLMGALVMPLIFIASFFVILLGNSHLGGKYTVVALNWFIICFVFGIIVFFRSIRILVFRIRYKIPNYSIAKEMKKLKIDDFEKYQSYVKEVQMSSDIVEK
jgi:hypothetical protein